MEIIMQGAIFKVKLLIHCFILLLFIIAFYVPFMSAYEMITTGSIDMEARSSGITRAPHWILYIAGWLVLLYLARAVFLPYLLCVIRGHVFALTDGSIIFGRESVLNEDIVEIVIRDRGISKLVTDKKVYSFYPAWTNGGTAALEVRYPELIVNN